MAEAKRIFITGGASGLGKAIALRFAKAGYAVCIGDLNDERGSEALAELKKITDKAEYLTCNVTQLADIERAKDWLVEHWGGVDIVVNNAGIAGVNGAVDSIEMDAWDSVIDINLKGVIRGCKVFTSLFKTQGSGYIVNVASVAGLIFGQLMSNYNVSKAGVVALSETLRKELKRFNIGITVVCPAFFKTNLGESIHSNVKGMDEYLAEKMESSKITSDDIAEQIYRAVHKNTFIVYGHAYARRAHLLKRWFPNLSARFF